LPLAVNASANAVLSSLGMKIGVAIVTTLLVAAGVTVFEKHRHLTACKKSNSCGCTPEFNQRRHFLRNLLIGSIVYTVVYVATHLPGIHAVLERYFGI